MKFGISIFVMIPNIIETKTLYHMIVKLYSVKIMVFVQDSQGHILKVAQLAQFQIILKLLLFIQV